MLDPDERMLRWYGPALARTCRLLSIEGQWPSAQRGNARGLPLREPAGFSRHLLRRPRCCAMPRISARLILRFLRHLSEEDASRAWRAIRSKPRSLPAAQKQAWAAKVDAFA